MKKLISAVAVAAIVAVAAPAQAATTSPVQVIAGSSFTDLLLGSFTLTGLSNVTGSLGYVENGTLTFDAFTMPVTFSSVSFSGGTIGTQSFSGPSFSLTNLAAGTYNILASGTVGSGIGGYVAADYNVAAVPEPESLAMLLAGLGIMGAVARRRSKQG